ncbi:hypothetical protein NB311A_09996 [Nitrobacter sp. Nb-311A]|nr:hypothetical protein NB311A_09996 [Nitrobacter sp. Nb-311A]
MLSCCLSEAISEALKKGDPGPVFEALVPETDKDFSFSICKAPRIMTDFPFPEASKFRAVQIVQFLPSSRLLKKPVAAEL